MKKKPLKVAITGGAGHIAYNLLFRLASGEAFGADQPLQLQIGEIPQTLGALKGVEMELIDCAFPLLEKVAISSDPLEFFLDVDVAILVGAKPRTKGMERGDLLQENGKIFVQQGRALNAVASRDVKVLVVGNPCNTNCWIAMHHAPNIPRHNFQAMTSLDHNRGVAALAARAQAPVKSVSRFTIWGNHSTTQVPDYTHAQIGGTPATKVINDQKWLEGPFISLVQNRGAEVIAARGSSSAGSAANAIVDSLKHLFTPTPSGQWYSSAISSDGNSYGIAEDLIFSFPCRTLSDGRVEIVSGLEIGSPLREKLAITERELLHEKELVQQGVKSK